MKAEVLKGHLDLVLLAALAGGPAHGYAVVKAVRERTGGVLDLPEGTLYPALHRLESGGLLRSDWAKVNGRRRRVYEITEEGRRSLADEQREWGTFSGAVDSMIRTVEP